MGRRNIEGEKMDGRTLGIVKIKIPGGNLPQGMVKAP
jgi:hypothetical protein